MGTETPKRIVSQIINDGGANTSIAVGIERGKKRNEEIDFVHNRIDGATGFERIVECALC